MDKVCHRNSSLANGWFPETIPICRPTGVDRVLPDADTMAAHRPAATAIRLQQKMSPRVVTFGAIVRIIEWTK